MVANQKQMKDLKQNMDSLFSFALQVPYKEGHLLPVVQASKSLIGMNVDHPPKHLLKWLDKYVKNFIPNFMPPPPPDQKSFPEAITYTHLGNLLLHNNESESYIYLTHLLQVADPGHIAEFLLELGAKKSPSSFLFCWATFRSIQFIGAKNGYLALYHCLAKLLDKEAGEQNNTNLLLEKFAVYCYQFQIRGTEMVRKNKIITPLDKMILAIEGEFNKADPPAIPKDLESMIKTEGKQGIISYLSILKIEDISANLILLMDALRSAMKFSNNPDELSLFRIFDNHREYEFVE